MTEEEDSQIQDIVAIEDISFSLSDIERMAEDSALLQEYQRKLTADIYSRIMLALTHENFGEREARRLWDGICQHLEILNRRLQRNVGIAVAALDYLTNIDPCLEQPILIEERKSDFVADNSTKDELTGLYLRRVFDVVLKKEFDQTIRTALPLSLILIDIDDFKQVNDRHGHLRGDQVLASIGRAINGHVREMDTAARYGGEELAIIMPNSTAQKAFYAAERLRRTIAGMDFDGLSVTVSMGVGCHCPSHENEQSLLAATDQALYEAKALGKNRVLLSE